MDNNSTLQEFEVVERCEWGVQAKNTEDAEAIITEGVIFSKALQQAIEDSSIVERFTESEPNSDDSYIVTEETSYTIKAQSPKEAYRLVRDGVGPIEELADAGYTAEVTERYVVGFDIDDYNCEDSLDGLEPQCVAS